MLQSKNLGLPIRLPLIGKHNVSNALAAAATAIGLGIPQDAIRNGLESVRGVPGRLQRIEPDGSPFSVLVDYAHTDDALRNVLSALRPLTPGRLICVFGCGGDRDRGKRPRMAAVVAELADIAFVTSDNPRSESPDSIVKEILTGFPRDACCRVEAVVDRQAAIFAAIEEARDGDTVLIAGKGHEDYQLVGDRVLHFDDVEVAREALQQSRTPKLHALQEEVA
jgi:UDP-N-acetylmuramoyl-L-alanyl-D-glutamate--2,6-diaminopimelate ligase